MSVKKAIIPVAGVGSRLRPHTHTQPKPMMPVAGKPILGHIIDSLIDSGITQQVFILGYLGEKIREYVEAEYTHKIEMEFVIQEPRKGLAHAIGLCKKEIQKSDEILIILGDTIFGDEIAQILASPHPNILGVQEVENPRKFGIVVTDENRKVIKAIEKPEIPVSNLAMVGIYKIKQIKILLQCINEMMIEESEKGKQFYLTDAIMKMIEKGVTFNAFTVDNWYDCGNRESLLETNRILLERHKIHPEYQFENTVILPPVYIASGCNIRNSIIGPYVAVAENSDINNSIVRDSIIGAYAQLEDIVLHKSVLGNDTTFKGKSHSVNVGDSTEIDLNE
ncbi:MAG: NTP transferase domain-containing protein [Bacteroidia bacterium]|nr:NTP transferase domain-containing protein [Bacteroidia bacterium]